MRSDDYKFTLLQQTDDAGVPIEGSFRLVLTFPDGKSLVRDDIHSEEEAAIAVEETMELIRSWYAAQGVEVGREVEETTDHRTGTTTTQIRPGFGRKEYMN